MVARFALGSRLPNLRWWTIILLGWIFLLARGTVHETLDELSDGTSWISARVEMMNDGHIRYGVCAFRPISGVWTAKIYDAEGRRIDSRKGLGDYSKPDGCVAPGAWTWTDFFTGYRADPPEVPDFPFRICVQYRMTSIETDVTKHSPAFCSEIHDPTEGNTR